MVKNAKKRILQAKLSASLAKSPQAANANKKGLDKRKIAVLAMLLISLLVAILLYNTNKCVIKGNINHLGERLYYPPNHHLYDVVKIDKNNGEFWFCSESQAIKAGWNYGR